MPGHAQPRVDGLRQEALAAARGLSEGESALVGVLRDLEQERSRAAEAYRAVVRSLAAALEARDGYTGEHSDAVHDVSVAVAHRLGLGAREVAEVEAVALLHDVGKIGIPDGILHKPGALTDDEWQLMREHPIIGERILRPLPGLSAVATAVRHEHERWDGRGYPDGLAGEDIPLASRIVLACDAYNALVSDRPYRRALSEARAIEELRRCTGTQFDPRVVDALLACLADPRDVVGSRDSNEDMARALTESGADHGERRLERELHALIAIASAVAAAHRLQDVVEVAADQACVAIDAASLSVSRWEAQRRVLRTLVNAGDLGPGEERAPADEIYRMDEDAVLRRLLEAGESHVASLDDPDVEPLERELLESLGKHHSIAVPIAFAGVPWGELWATRRADQPRFTDRDVRFLQTICGQVAAAVGRAELFSHMAELAFEDPLTGVANRRAVDERLEVSVTEAVESGRDLAVLLCDVDNLKELNDAHGHSIGDATLVRVAEVLRTAAAPFDAALVARVGGDEFCVVLENATAEDARRLGERVLARLSAGDGPQVTVSCGVASVGLGARRAGDLLRAADAAQYTAKRGGRARVCVFDGGIEAEWTASRSERRAIRGRARPGRLDVGAVLAAALDELDGPLAGHGALDRAEAVALIVSASIDASACCVSWCPRGSGVLETVFLHDRRLNRSSGHRFGSAGERYVVADYPETERVLRDGGAFVVLAADADADRAERDLLVEWGMTGVLAVGGTGADGRGWLVELYSDAASGSLDDAVDPLRLLLGEALRGAAAANAGAGVRPLAA